MSMNSAQVNPNSGMSEAEIDEQDPYLKLLNEGFSIDEICEMMNLPPHPSN